MFNQEKKNHTNTHKENAHKHTHKIPFLFHGYTTISQFCFLSPTPAPPQGNFPLQWDTPQKSQQLLGQVY